MSASLFDYASLFSDLADEGFSAWAEDLKIRCQQAISVTGHGNLEDWKAAWSELPAGGAVLSVNDGRVTASREGNVPSPEQLTATLMKLHPWRKGPFELFGVHIDTEWHSDWKWARLQDHIDLRDRSVLDVGSGNGYYGWRMLLQGARRVVGLDPFLLYAMQHEAIKRCIGSDLPNFVLPLGDDCLPPRLNAFDVTFSMGVLYHRTSPIDHLQSLAGTLRNDGELVLETLVVDSSEETVLVPHGRYGKMRNVWFIPSVPMLKLWLKRTGFRDVKVIDVSPTTTNEQRSTEWMTFESLENFLDPADHSKTIEGYPGPLRATIIARL
jgi:tRNA (mo5U34)-methyltransferase